MPALPTLTPNDSQFARIVAAWPGETNAEKIASYRRWLAASVLDAVQDFEAQGLDAKHFDDRVAAQKDAEQALAGMQ